MPPTTAAVLDPKQPTVTIERVENGWIVRSGMAWDRGGNGAVQTAVARTPKELSDLVTDWSQRQADGEGRAP